VTPTLRVLCLLAVGLALAAPALVRADPPPGRMIPDMRRRAEFVDQDRLPKAAEALTARTRLGCETPAWRGLTVLVEGETVTALDGAYNSTAATTLARGREARPRKVRVPAQDFTCDNGARRYGRLRAGLPLTPGLAAELKAAVLEGATAAFADRTKVWMTLHYRY
jgi:hypothetical protein